MAKVNQRMVEQVAQKVKELSLSDMVVVEKFPPVGDPGVLDYFFAVTMQEYGFWVGDDKGYVKPLYGHVDGQKLKGSDLLWRLSKKAYEKCGPEFFNPNRLAKLEYDQFITLWLPESYGFQDMMTRYTMVVEYGQQTRSFTDSLSRYTSNVAALSSRATNPLKTFLDTTSWLPGYSRDRLLKKNLLLAMILTNRPEHFLNIKPEDFANPIIDTHFMRVGERLGIIELTSEEYQKLSSRVWVTEEIEQSVRKAAYDSFAEVIRLSGKTMTEVDGLIWPIIARKLCLEMEQPKCGECPLADTCEKHIKLFQPVFRTTNY